MSCEVEPGAKSELGLSDPMAFRCHRGLPCFTTCCRDVNIFLSPYDILRMKNGLKISSGDFLERYTISLIPEASGFPVILLKMVEEKNKACPFVSEEGCSIYADRPWACRMFPLDQGGKPGSFRFITDPSFCLGMREEGGSTVQGYLEGQELAVYNENERLLSGIASNPRFAKTVIENRLLQEMCRMALYDLDRFRRFVLETRFLKMFQVDKELAERIVTDDTALMRLAFKWLEFGLISGDTLGIREDLLKAQAAAKEKADSDA